MFFFPVSINVVVSAENMNTEAEFMLSHYAGIPNASEIINVSRNESIRPDEKKQVTASYQKHYVNVSQENINLLREIYKYEIYLFGYPDTPFVDFVHS